MFTICLCILRRKTTLIIVIHILRISCHGRYNYLLLVTCCIISSACAFDMFAFSTVVTAASCDLNLDFTKIGILVSAPLVGVVFAFPWGYYADTQGRRRAILVSTSVGFVFAFISAFSTHWLFMLVIKIIGCSFSAASITSTIALLGECTGSKHRKRYLFILNSVNISCELCSFALALLILPLNIQFRLPLLNTTFQSWRLYTIVIALPLAIGGFLLLSLYESPKYLASRGESKKAVEVLRKIYVRNGGKEENCPVKYITDTDVETTLTKLSFWESFKKQTIPIFKPPLLWRTIQLFFLMALCYITNNTFYMWYPTIVNNFFKSWNTGNTSQQTFCQRMFGEANMLANAETVKCPEKISPNMLYSGILNSFFFLLMSLASLKFSSRPRLFLITVLFVSGVSQLLLSLNNPIANLIFFTLLQDTTLGIGCLSIYFVNLYPTANRGLVTSLGMMVARFSSLVGVNLVGSVITQHCEVTFYVWSAVVFGGIVVSVFLPPDRPEKDCNIKSSPS